MKIQLYTILLATIVSGCTNTVWVREKQQNGGEVTYEQLGGIPFFIKKEVWNQSTTYSQTWLKASLTIDKKLVITKDDKPSYFDGYSQVFTKQIVKERLPDLYKIKEQIMKAGILQNNEVNELVIQFSSIESDLDINDIVPDRVGNTITSSWVVDEKNKFYLNAPLPWFGTGNLTQEINSDGTLSKVVSNPDTKLAEGLSSLIPFKEYFTGKYVDPLGDNSDADAAEKISDVESLTKSLPDMRLSEIKPSSKILNIVSLNIEETGYLYTFSKTHEEITPNVESIPYDLDSGFYTRTSLGGEKKIKERKDEGEKIGLSGSISFPEGWGKD